ncbi:protein SMG9 isoform X3 [Carcharodon carcharias]|uniref:protein SMG9 isoform X3 n=1 Tax=Carcharodon carcharias TaxID=13397 RepID=UPI001B7D98F0|nr:protein SMG9 isoform X3 [Carcharodon carcharias]
MQKTPIILAKPPAERGNKATPTPAAPAGNPTEKPIVLMKARDEGKPPATGDGASQAPAASGKTEKEFQRPTQPVYQIQNRGMAPSAPSSNVDPVIGQAKLHPPERMKHAIKLVDDQMNWCDSAMEYLLDQTDVLVIGIIGLQGTGKSTIMSLLSSNTPEEDQRSYVFRAQTQEIKERGGNQTNGIDFFITQERIIFLDTQPILSPAVLDHLINNDRKLPPEYSLPHTYVEMQSLQMAAFLFTVCHAVLLVQDWFTDLNLYRGRRDVPVPTAPGLQRSPQLPVAGQQAEEPNPVHVPASALAHHPHREKLVPLCRPDLGWSEEVLGSLGIQPPVVLVPASPGAGSHFAGIGGEGGCREEAAESAGRTGSSRV